VATVVTIETTIEPSKKKLTHSLVIAGDHARAGDELDVWRLFDLKQKSVTYVDEIAKSYRTESIASLAQNRNNALALPIDVTSNAGQITIRAGRYIRELTIAEHPLIPPQLFSMMIASDAPMMKKEDDALLGVRGFPMSDHAEVPLDGKKLAIDRKVVRIERKNVDAAWLQIPRGFAASPQPASSPRSHPATPVEELRSFVTGRKSL